MAGQFDEDLIAHIVWDVFHVPWLVYDPAGQLLSGAGSDFLLTLGGDGSRLLQLCREAGGPQVLATELNHLWAGVPVILDGALSHTLVFGPVYTSEPAPNAITEYARSHHLPAVMRDRLAAACQAAPIYPYIDFARLVAAVYAIIYRAEFDVARLVTPGVSPAVVQFSVDAQAYQGRRVYDENYVHATYAFEQQIWDCVRQGELERLKRHLYAGTYGNVGPIGGDPVRQQKNTFICAVTLATRAAIEGGLSPETAYSLSDLYIQQVETMRNVLGIVTLSESMLYDLTTRVRALRRPRTYSKLVTACCNYIEEHVRERLSTAEVAAVTGFSADYVARKFKAETGRSIGDTIRAAKVSEAQALLKYSELSLAEISELLAFSSQSFFTATFKELTGTTPAQFRDNAAG